MKELKNRKIETNILNDNIYAGQSQPHTNRTSKDLKIIKFTGDMKENTNNLMEGIQCNCGIKRDYFQIIHAYSDKISKLREERNRFRDLFNHQKFKNEQIHEMNKKLVEEVAKLQTQMIEIKKNHAEQEQQSLILEDNREQLKIRIKQLQDQKIIIYQAYKDLQCNFNQLNLQLIEAQNSLKAKEPLSRIKRDDKLDVSSLLGDSIHDLFDDKTQIKLCLKQNQLLKAKLNKFQQILGIYGCTLQESNQILENHFKNMPRFETQQQRNLFRMATQMNADLWKKKLQMQVRSLHQKKAQIRKMQQTLNKKQTK